MPNLNVHERAIIMLLKAYVSSLSGIVEKENLQLKLLNFHGTPYEKLSAALVAYRRHPTAVPSNDLILEVTKIIKNIKDEKEQLKLERLFERDCKIRIGVAAKPKVEKQSHTRGHSNDRRL